MQLFRTFLVASLISWGVLAVAVADAQIDTRYHLRVASAGVPVDENVDLRVALDNFGEAIQGFSFGLCHDSSMLELRAIDLGSTVRTVKGGEAADFIDLAEYPDGWTTGVLFCFIGCASLGEGSDLELFVATYHEKDGTIGRTSDVCFCDTLGSPTVEPIVVVDGFSILPATQCGQVEVIDVPPFRYSVATSSAEYSPIHGGGIAEVDLSIVEVEPLGGGLEVDAFSLGIEHDPALLQPLSIEVIGAVAAVNNGNGPDFVGPNLHHDGATLGTIFSFTSDDSLFFPTETAVVRVIYQTVSGALIGDEIGRSTELVFVDTLHTPPVRNVVVVEGTSHAVELTTNIFELVPVLATPFRRGDCNNDTNSNIADGVWLLNYMFTSGPASGCLAACDTDGDGLLGLLDAIMLIQHWIIGGPPPVAPYPGCGTDVDADCETYAGCADEL